MVRESGDGHFEVYYRHGWAHLIVYPPSGKGKPVYPEEIQNRMKLLNIPKVEPKKIRDIIENASGKPERLVEWPDGARLASQIIVDLADDEMSAWVTVLSPKKGAAPPETEDIIGELESQGIVFGIDREAVEKLLFRRDYDRKVPVAWGRAPVHRQSATIRYHFQVNRGKPYLEMDFGRINLKELNFIENKKTDDLLAELLPPVEPVNGKTVLGRVLPADTEKREVRLQGGKNTKLNEEGTALYAADNGNVRLEKGQIIVEPVVTVENVNYETGNIYFDGSVVVNKGVADGFVVEAEGDIQVGKGVGKAALKAGGNILLKTGINGNNEGRIECDGDLFAKYIESSTVICRNNVIVEEAIMHSRLSAWKHCVLNGRRGEIIGSTLMIGGSLWCKKLGSIYDSPTHAAIGISPEVLSAFREAKEALDKDLEKVSKIEEQLEQIDHALEGMKGNETEEESEEILTFTDQGEAPGEHTEGNKKREKLLQIRRQLEDALREMQLTVPDEKQKLHGLRDKLKASRESICVVEDTIYKGAVIMFGREEYRVSEKGARKTILKIGEQGIQESGFNPKEKPELVFDPPEE